ncbi:sigma-70 family RNA polymerase sigma factor [Anaerococcus nagyae]|uniref:RNA polymerase sigma factor n=1 Tax=Anaerococcus nagyae TaxID=1755241 RepID=UPI0032521F07
MDIEKIYHIYFDDIYKFMLSFTKNKEISQDITSETFLKVINNPGKFENISNLKSYLFTIAKNTYINYYKHNKIYISTADIEDFDKGIESFENELLANEEKQNLKTSIEKLNEPYKEITKLRLAGLSFKEIAIIYNKSPNRACVNFYRAKEKLKIIMEEDYGM